MMRGYGEYPSKTWGFNYQPNPQDYKSVAYPTFLSMFQNYVSLYNKFVDHAAQRINELQGYVSTLDKKVLINNTILASHDGSINELSRRINAVNTTLGSHDGSINTLARRLNSVDTIIKSNEGSINVLTRRANTVDSIIASFDGSINSLARRLNTNDSIIASFDGSINSLARRLNTNDSIIASFDGSINSLARRLNANDSIIASFDGSINSLARRLNTVEPILTSHDGSINALTRRLNTTDEIVSSFDGSINLLSRNLTSQTLRIDGLKSESDKQGLSIKALVASDLLINSKVNKIQEQIDSFEKLSDYFAVELTSVEGDNSNAQEGSFVKLFKGQITRLNTFNENLFRKLTYQLVKEFLTIYDSIKLNALETQNVIAEYSLLINTNLETVNAWLQKIYEKPFDVEIPPITVLPANPFVLDYDRLQKMFDGISFGSITNEAGENIWDFLGKLVKALADVVKALGDLVVKIMEMLIDLIIPKDPSVITNFFKNFNDKLDVKFEGFNQIGDLLSNSFTVSESEFKDVTFNFNGKKQVIISKEIPNQFAPTIKLILSALVWVLTLMMCHKRLSTEVVK